MCYSCWHWRVSVCAGPVGWTRVAGGLWPLRRGLHTLCVLLPVELHTCITHCLLAAVGAALTEPPPPALTSYAVSCKGQSAPLTICNGIDDAKQKAACRGAVTTVNKALA